MVARLCASMGVPHETRVWVHDAIDGNLMDAARRARMTLISDWARANSVSHVALGHTADDQAETFLMALSRASGLDGLVGMRRNWRQDGIEWSRPLLGQSRAGLRAYLRRHVVAWAEDPTNEDPRYERVRARHALATLAPLGIDAGKIAHTLNHLGMANHALDALLRRAVDAHVVEVAGALRVDRAGFDAFPHELQRRMLVSAIAWLSGNPVPPRSEKQINLLFAARDGRDATLQGCRLRVKADHLLLVREMRAVVHQITPPDQAWDRRWHLGGPPSPGLTVRALGAGGLRACPDWRATGLPREVLIVTPAIWHGEALVAAPLAGLARGWGASLSPSYKTFILSH